MRYLVMHNRALCAVQMLLTQMLLTEAGQDSAAAVQGYQMGTKDACWFACFIQAHCTDSHVLLLLPRLFPVQA